MKQPKLTVTKDFTEGFNATIRSLKAKEVLVGIPEAKGPRKADDPINNAALLYINEYGSPINNIPPRPAMKIGIKDAKLAVIAQFKLCAQNILNKGSDVIDVYFERVGIIASNSVKRVINNQGGESGTILSPSAATLAARAYAGFKGTKALVVSGQMRNAITYVVRFK